MLNALERLCNAYVGEIAGAEQDLSIAESQLHDYQARIGKPFVHDAYQAELTQLRGQLKLSLSGITTHSRGNERPVSAAEATVSTAELADRTKSLRTEHSIEAGPDRSGPQRLDAEEPVTTRIRRRDAISEIPRGKDESVPTIAPMARSIVEGPTDEDMSPNGEETLHRSVTRNRQRTPNPGMP